MAIPTSRSRNNKSRTNTSSSTTTRAASSSSPSSHHPLLMNNNNNNNPTLCPTTATAPYAYYTPQYFTASAHHVGAPILISTATATTAATAAATTSHHNHHAFPIYPFQPIPLSHQQQQQLYLPTITMNSATFDLMNNSDHDDNNDNNNNNKNHSHKNNHNKKNDKPSSVFLSCPSPKKEVHHHHHNSTTPTVVTTPTTPTLITLDTDQSNTSSFLLLDTNNNNDNNNNNSIDINNDVNNDVNDVNNDDDGYYCCDSILNQEQFELQQQQQPLDGEWNDVLMLIDNNSSETSPFISLTSSLSSPSSSSNGSSHDNVGDDDHLMMMRNISSEDDNDDGSPSLMAMMMDRDGYDEDDIVNDDEYLRALTHDHSSLSSENVVETATKKRRVSKSESVNVSSVSPSLSGDESSELSLSPSPVNSSSSSSSSSSNKRKREVSEEIDDERELNRLNQIPTSQLTDADKRLKKKLRNRQSARRSRENKKHELQVAQELNAQLTSTCTQLKHEVNDLKAKVQLLEKENEQLKFQLKLTNGPLKSDKSLLKNNGNASKAKTVMLFSVLFCVGFLFHCLPSLFSSNTPIGSSTPALYNMPSSYGPMEASPSAMYPYHNRRGVNRQGMRLLTASPSSDNDKQKSQHQLPQHEEESISVEKEQTSQNESQFFNGEQMIKKQVVYPHPLKQHFSLGTKETLGTEKRLVSLPDTVESRITNDGLVGDFSLQNSKQLAMIPMALTHEASSAFLYNQMNRRGLEVGHTYQIPQERFIDDDASVRLICPYIYPLLNKNAPRGENMGNFRMQDLKNKYIKLLVPIQTINTDQGRRVVRMAEISARDISFGELYLEM